MKFPTEILLRLSIPLGPPLIGIRANCFNAVQAYFDDTDKLQFVEAEEFVLYMQAKFHQIPVNDSATGDVQIVWSRSASVLPIGDVRIERLNKRYAGYPFGLVIEHAFVLTTASNAFQKRDPSAVGPYEIVSLEEAVAPYAASPGMEITAHRRADRTGAAN